MSIEHPPHDKQSARRDTFRNAEHAGNVVPLREGNDVRQASETPHQGDELLTALSPLLDEVDGLRADETLHQEANNVVGCSKRMPGFASLRSSCQICLAIFPRKAREIEAAAIERRRQSNGKRASSQWITRRSR